VLLVQPYIGATVQTFKKGWPASSTPSVGGKTKSKELELSCLLQFVKWSEVQHHMQMQMHWKALTYSSSFFTLDEDEALFLGPVCIGSAGRKEETGWWSLLQKYTDHLHHRTVSLLPHLSRRVWAKTGWGAHQQGEQISILLSLWQKYQQNFWTKNLLIENAFGTHCSAECRK